MVKSAKHIIYELIVVAEILKQNLIVVNDNII